MAWLPQTSHAIGHYLFRSAIPPKVRSAMPAAKNTPTPDEDFEYTTESGAKIVLAPFNSVKTGLIRKIRYQTEGGQFFSILEELADEKTLEIVDEMPSQELQTFRQAWYKHSGLNLGE